MHFSMNLTLKPIHNMTITQYIPNWLRSRLAKPQKTTTQIKKQAQVLPTAPKIPPDPKRFQQDDSPPGYRVLWKM